MKVEHGYDDELPDLDRQFAFINYSAKANSIIHEIDVIFNRVDALFDMQLLRLAEFSGPFVNALSLFINTVDVLSSKIICIARYCTNLYKLKISCEAPQFQHFPEEEYNNMPIALNYSVETLILS